MQDPKDRLVASVTRDFCSFTNYWETKSPVETEGTLQMQLVEIKMETTGVFLQIYIFTVLVRPPGAVSVSAL